MRKIITLIALLALPSFAALNLMTWDGSKNTDFNDTANWTGTVASGSTLGAGDSCLMNAGAVAATASANVSIGCIITTSGYSGNLSFSGRTLTTVAGAAFDGTGTLHLGNGYTQSGNGTFHIGTGVGAVTSTSCAMSIAGTSVIDVDKSGLSLRTLSVSAVSTNSGAVVISFEAPAIPFTIGNSATFTNNTTTYFILSSTGTFASVGSGVTINGTGDYYFVPSGSGNTVTLPALSHSGSGTILISPYYSGAINHTLQLGGNLICGKVFGFRNIATSGTTTLSSANYSITCTDFRPGSTGAATTNLIFGSSVIDISSFTGTTYNTQASTCSLQTSQWTCSGNWAWGTLMTVIPGTSSVTIDSIGTITGAGKSFYKFSVNATGAGNTITLADSLQCNDSLLIIDGALADAGKAIYCATWYQSSADSSILTGRKSIAYDLIKTATANTKGSAASIWRFYGAQNSKLTLAGKKLEKVRIVKDAAANGLTLQDSPDTLSSLLDSVGYFVQNKKIVVDSSNWFRDSVKIDTNFYVYDTLNFLTACKTAITGLVTFQGGTAGRCDTCDAMAAVTVNKTANIAMGFYGNTRMSTTILTAGRTTFNKRADVGSLQIDAVDTTWFKDTLYDTGKANLNCGILLFDKYVSIGDSLNIGACVGYSRFTKKVAAVNMKISNTDSTIFKDTVTVSGNYTSADNAKVKWDRTCLIFTGAAPTMTIHTSGSNAHLSDSLMIQPQHSITIAADSANTIFAFEPVRQNAGQRYTMPAGVKPVTTMLSTPDYSWSGTGTVRDTLNSSVPGVRSRIKLATPKTDSLIVVKDRAFQDNVFTCHRCVNGGNDSNAVFDDLAPVITTLKHPMGRIGYRDTCIGSNFLTLGGSATLGGTVVTINKQVDDTLIWTVPTKAKGTYEFIYNNGTGLKDTINFRVLIPFIGNINW